MAIYLFSDDNYFAVGLNGLIRKENMILCAYGWEKWEPHFVYRQIFPGDILLLDGSSEKFIKKSLCFPLNQQLAKIFIFYDNRKKLIPAFSCWSHGARSMNLESLGITLDRLHQQATLQSYHPGLLTRRESQIIGLICRSFPIYRIAQELSVSIKTISNHKNNALRKLGVGSINELLI